MWNNLRERGRELYPGRVVCIIFSIKVTFNFFLKKSIGIQVNSQFQQEFPSLQAAGDQEKKEKETNDDNYGPGPSLRPPSKSTFSLIQNEIIFVYYLTIQPPACCCIYYLPSLKRQTLYYSHLLLRYDFCTDSITIT